MPSLYQQVLLFPDRAENLGRFSAYKVRFDHWQSLSAEFKACFREVYERGHAAILLLHGEQGSGKTLFARRLQHDFEDCQQGNTGTAKNNLWNALVGDSSDPAVVRTATTATAVNTIQAENGWLDHLRGNYRKAQHQVRVFIADDAHKAGFLRPWAGLSQEEFLRVGVRAALPAIAERMVELCRGDFRQSLFVLCSARSSLMLELHAHIEETHRGLSRPIELPLPEASVKEEIVRQNTNSLNPISYWYCLDGAGPKGKEDLYEVLHEKKGFTDTFQAVDRAFQKTVTRAGRPSNKNLLTLCTLGSTPAEVGAFINAQDLALDREQVGDHLGVWYTARNSWASALVVGSDAETARKAKLVESEFALRWVALGPLATRIILDLSHELTPQLLSALRFAPSIAKPDETANMAQAIRTLDEGLKQLDTTNLEVSELIQGFRRLGQQRSTVYESALRRHFADGYGRSFEVYSRLRPDVILGEYIPCTIANTNGKDKTITRAISRKGHSIEFTSFLGDELNGLDAYMRDKIIAYARMLESV